VMPFGSRSVWVVDDSPTDAAQAAAALAGYEVRVFHDGATVLEQVAHQAPPDVLVLDWTMPGVSGIDVARFLRSSQGRKPHVAILLVTAHRATNQVSEGLASGANDYLAKPYAPEELQARVGALVRAKELLERVELAEDTVSRLLTLTPDALIVVDAHGRLTYANPEAERVLATSAVALIGRPLTEVLPTLELGVIRASGGDGVPLRDVTIGDQVFAPTARLLPDDFDATATIALRNVTERRRAEARRLDFYSIVAHDLRTPLSAMMLRTDHILHGGRGLLSAELIGDLRKIQGNINSMVALINDFLDLARLEGGGYQLIREEIDLVALIRTSIEDLRPVLEHAGLTIRLEVPTGPTPIVGDRRRLAQVLGNLLSNAIKFTPADGTITVALIAHGRDLELRVSDTGVGIPEAALSTLFKRYTRVVQDRAGTGLGLMIVREIAEAHGGSVGVESEVGKGSTFWVRLPVRVAATARTQVLVVDDDPDLRDTLEMLLTAEGYRVATAVNGRIALDRMLGGDVPAMILLDMSMPVMSGPELLGHLARDPELARVPVLIMSGDLSIPLAPPGSLVLQKPIHVDRLLDHIARQLRGARPAVNAST